jgi:hypothetical protein
MGHSKRLVTLARNLTAALWILLYLFEEQVKRLILASPGEFADTNLLAPDDQSSSLYVRYWVVSGLTAFVSNIGLADSLLLVKCTKRLNVRKWVVSGPSAFGRRAAKAAVPLNGRA